MTWLLVKYVHILSSTVLFGTGLGIAWFMWKANRDGDVATIAGVARQVVIADLVFTTPAVIVQPLSGLWLMHAAGLGWQAPDGGPNWIGASLLLYALAGACWLPVLALQLRLRDLARAARDAGRRPGADYARLLRWWTALGVPAFAALLGAFWLMVAKPF